MQEESSFNHPDSHRVRELKVTWFHCLPQLKWSKIQHFVFQDCLEHPAILYGSYPGVTIAETNWIILKAEKFKEEGGRSKT